MTEIAKIQDQTEATAVAAVEEKHRRVREKDFTFFLGQINSVSTVATQLTSAVINNIRRIRDEKLYLALNYDRFEEFLDEHEHSPMKYKRFNYLEKMYKDLGQQTFDLLLGSGLSARQMRQLKEGDVVVDGSVVRIGSDDVVELGDDRKIKSLVEELISDRQAEKAAREKAEKAAEAEAERNRRGESENDNLRRQLDELRSNNGSRFGNALMGVLQAFFNLTEAVGELTDEEKAARKVDDLRLVNAQYFRLQDAYGSDGGHVPLQRPADGELDSIDRAIAEMDFEGM